MTAGVLTEVTGGRRNRVYLSKRVFDIVYGVMGGIAASRDDQTAATTGTVLNPGVDPE
jgi:hypothetical protein